MALEVKCQESHLFSKRCPAHCISWVLPETSSYHHLYVQDWWPGQGLCTGCWNNISAVHLSWGCPAKASLIQATLGWRNREQGGLTDGWNVRPKGWQSVQQSLGWRPEVCVPRPLCPLCPQRSLLGKYCSNTSINDAAGGAECALSKSADDTSRRRGWHGGWLCCTPAGLRQADETGWQDPHQFNKDKYQVLGRNNHMHQSMLGSTTWKAALQGRTW